MNARNPKTYRWILQERCLPGLDNQHARPQLWCFGLEIADTIEPQGED